VKPLEVPVKQVDGSVAAGFGISTANGQPSPRAHNLCQVLRTLRDRGPRSRARLAGDLGLTKATVSSLVSELIERGLVRDGAVERGAVGRPGLTVELDGRQVCGVGAEVNVNHVATFALDLTGTVVSERRRDLDALGLKPAEVLDHLAELLRTTLGDVEAAGARPVALTVGVAGIVDVARSVVTLAPNLGWRDVAVVDLLRQRLGDLSQPVLVDNEANLAAIAESANGGESRRDMLVIFGEAGIGGGIVADGSLVRGSHGYAGEFGHMVVDPQGRRCGCGRTGCWETVIGLRALLENAADPEDFVHDPARGLDDRLRELDRRAAVGDHRTRAALDRLGDWIGVGAALLTNALNPSTIVLSGYFADVGPWVREALERRLETDVLAPHAGGTRIELSTLGSTAAVRGAALVALETVLTDPTRVERRVVSPIGGAR
jgi:predicted NBD/HSP70 family sugar kinase